MSSMLDSIENNSDEKDLSEALPKREDADALKLDDTLRNGTVLAEIAAIEQDVEDDLYNRDGDTNDSELAGQRLAAISGRLTGAFAQAASGLSIMIGAAILKKEAADKDEALISLQNQQEQKKEKDAEAASDEGSEISGDIQKQQQKEREEWAQTQHSYFGADLSGDEWGDLADQVGQKGPVRDRLVKRLMEQGKSKADAEKKADEMGQVYRILSKPESQWTDDEKAKVQAAKTDPDFQKNTADVAQYMKQERQAASLGAENKVEQVSASASTAQSVTVGADVLALTEAGGETSAAVDNSPDPTKRSDILANSFPTAPDLTSHYQAAAVPADKVPEAKTVQEIAFAQAKPIPAANAGFDV